MSNAWFYYLGPLLVSAGFVTAGIACLYLFVWGGRNADGTRKYGPNAIAGAFFTLGVGGSVGLVILIKAPTPGERERLFVRVFRTPPERIERFIIKGGKAENVYKPLTYTEVVIDDPARIRQIADILGAATEEKPNHPHSMWTANVEMVTHDGTYHFSVNRTVPGHPNGTLLSPMFPKRGWNLGDWRADGLEKVLEEAVNKSRKPD